MLRLPKKEVVSPVDEINKYNMRSGELMKLAVSGSIGEILDKTVFENIFQLEKNSKMDIF